jgi:hypothetical protein
LALVENLRLVCSLPKQKPLVSGRADFFEYVFNDPVQGVGGTINWGTNDVTVGPWGASISVYDASNNLIEEATLSNSGTNLLPPDSFYGFLENSPNISRALSA